MTIIYWFRRDLRLKDNLALQAALQKSATSAAPVIPLFILDPAILNSNRFSPPRYKFMLGALKSLNTELRRHQRQMLIRHGSPQDMLRTLVSETGASAVYFNIDYTPYARGRDAAVQQMLQDAGVEIHTFHDRLMIPPGGIEKNDGGPYVVFTPFKNKWRKLDKPPQASDYEIQADQWHTLNGLKNDGIPEMPTDTIDVPQASEHEAHNRLELFLTDRIHDYDDARNRLGNPNQSPQTGTSFLSPYIRFGLISTRTIYWAARAAYQDTRSDSARESITSFVDEIIWHEFYTHILWHFPEVKTHNFYDKYDAVEWQHSERDLQAWKDGTTGYPIVDAAMRQLKATGWMHNRARMIVASFLTKDLLIDWREGELHFMQWLLDGDLAANNGGWQWAAGTGTDAQPYFRIFNPVSQSRKFDPDGEFIRCWVPELRDVPDEFIHEPWKMDQPPAAYPAPIIDHSIARERTLERFKAALS